MIKGYDDIVGYKEIKAMLKRTAKRETGFHAVIFSGEAGCGKGTLAGLFAMSLLCEKHTGEPCMTCPACRKALNGSQPDLIRITHEKPESVGVEDIRRQLVDDIAIRPFDSRYKVYIIPDAQMMTVQAQNALLKTLEEPPSYGVILLLADNTEALLPTILSRCSLITLNPLSDEIVADYLVRELQVPERYAKIYAAVAMGKVGTAIKLAKSEEFANKLQESIRFLKKSKEMDNNDRIEMSRRLAVDKKEIYDYLEIFTIWFRDVLYYKATKETESLLLKEELPAIKRRAEVSSYEGLQKILDSIDNARTRLRANVNPELAMELLFLTISEN